MGFWIVEPPDVAVRKQYTSGLIYVHKDHRISILKLWVFKLLKYVIRRRIFGEIEICFQWKCRQWIVEGLWSGSTLHESSIAHIKMKEVNWNSRSYSQHQWASICVSMKYRKEFVLVQFSVTFFVNGDQRIDANWTVIHVIVKGLSRYRAVGNWDFVNHWVQNTWPACWPVELGDICLSGFIFKTRTFSQFTLKKNMHFEL